MKDVVSAFGSDVLRPLVSLVVPGSIAVAPGMAALLWANPWLRCAVMSNRNEFTAALVLLVLFAGLLCEDLGSHLEFLFDCLLDNPSGKAAEARVKDAHGQNWYEYLRIAYRIEPIGHHYMRTLVIRLKFELGSCAAFVFATLGIWWMPTTYGNRVLSSILPLVLVAVSCVEAKLTHELLSNLRAELLKGIREWPEAAPRAAG